VENGLEAAMARRKFSGGVTSVDGLDVVGGDDGDGSGLDFTFRSNKVFWEQRGRYANGVT